MDNKQKNLVRKQCNHIIKNVKENYQKAVELQLINEQWFLDYLDELNEISVRN